LQGAGRIRLARTKINIFKHSSIRVFNFYIKYSKKRRIFFAEGLKILIFCLSLHSYKNKLLWEKVIAEVKEVKFSEALLVNPD
jgi:hypothetical protein